MIFVLLLLVCLAAVILLRTARFRPLPEEKREVEPVSFDADAAVAALGKLVRCRTVSYADHSLEDEGEFEKLIGLLPALYPRAP